MTIGSLWLPSLAVPKVTAPPVPGFVIWFDATQIQGQSDGTVLASWSDLSGNGNTVSQAGSNKPTYWSTNISGHLINGLPTVAFQASGSTRLTATATASISVTACTLLAVFGHGDGATAAEGLICNRNPVGNTNWGYYAGGNQWNGSNYTGPGFANQSTPWMLSLTQSSTQYNVWKNGTAAGGNPYANGLGPTGTNTLELGGSTQTGEYMTADIGEVVFYSSVLSTSDRQSVESYLRSKWGTP